MKKIFIVLVLGVGAWWLFVGGRTLTEEHIEDFYHKAEAATLKRDPKSLCALFADDFESSGTIRIAGRSESVTQNKTQVCDGYDVLYQNFEMLGEKMGGTLHLNSHYIIHGIEIARDKKSAKVDISTSLDVAGSIMNIKSRSTDTLIRRNGKTLLLHSDGIGSISSGG